MGQKKTDRVTILTAAQSWLDELEGEIIPGVTTDEEYEGSTRQAVKLRHALEREYLRRRQTGRPGEPDRDEAPAFEIDGLTVAVWRSALQFDEGQPVVQIDGHGMFRINVNDGPVWNADPDSHEHDQCSCVTLFEKREEA